MMVDFTRIYATKGRVSHTRAWQQWRWANPRARRHVHRKARCHTVVLVTHTRAWQQWGWVNPRARRHVQRKARWCHTVVLDSSAHGCRPQVWGRLKQSARCHTRRLGNDDHIDDDSCAAFSVQNLKIQLQTVRNAK